jgi:hypothetical protein
MMKHKAQEVLNLCIGKGDITIDDKKGDNDEEP